MQIALAVGTLLLGSWVLNTPDEDQETTTEPFEATAVTFTGTPGRVRGVAAGEGSDGRPVPSRLVAVTVKV